VIEFVLPGEKRWQAGRSATSLMRGADDAISATPVVSLRVYERHVYAAFMIRHAAAALGSIIAIIRHRLMRAPTPNWPAFSTCAARYARERLTGGDMRCRYAA